MAAMERIGFHRIRQPVRHMISTAIVGPLLLAGCSDRITFLSPHGPVAAAQRGYFLDIILILLIVVLPVLLLTPVIAWRYRYHNKTASYRPTWSFSWPLEILAWGVPFGVVIYLAIGLWRGTHALDPYASLFAGEHSLPVDIVGYDWKWLFIYPTLGVASMGEFPMPVGRSVAIKLTSDSVMQSFFIPSLGSQIYAMPGMVTQLNLEASTAGRYRGENTQYNGEGFALERFTAVAMPVPEFRAWLYRARANGIALTPQVYATLSSRGKLSDTLDALHAPPLPDGALNLRSVPPKLFAQIVASFHGGPKNPAALIAASQTSPSEDANSD